MNVAGRFSRPEAYCEFGPSACGKAAMDSVPLNVSFMTRRNSSWRQPRSRYFSPTVKAIFPGKWKMNKSVLVTGSSRGIGKAIALRLARDGYDVIVHCRGRREEADAVAQTIIQLKRQSR